MHFINPHRDNCDFSRPFETSRHLPIRYLAIILLLLPFGGAHVVVDHLVAKASRSMAESRSMRVASRSVRGISLTPVPP